jgi:hypothetical protein
MSNEQLDAISQPVEQTAKIDLSIAELNVVLAALQELPHRIADPVIKKVVAQAQSQLGQPQQG